MNTTVIAGRINIDLSNPQDFAAIEEALKQYSLTPVAVVRKNLVGFHTLHGEKLEGDLPRESRACFRAGNFGFAQMIAGLAKTLSEAGYKFYGDITLENAHREMRVRVENAQVRATVRYTDEQMAKAMSSSGLRDTNVLVRP